MKRSLSLIIIVKDPKTQRETQRRYDGYTGFPRLKLFVFFIKAVFSGSAEKS